MTGTFKAILVPLDGSELAEDALPLAIELARRGQGTLHLLMVHQPMPAWGSLAEPATLAQADVAVRAQYQHYLPEVAERAGREGVKVVTAVKEGTAAEQILRYAQSEGIDLVAMTTHGRGGFSRAWLGSVTDAVVRSTRVPVLCVRRDPKETVLDRVLVGLDGSAGSEASLAPAATLAHLLGAQVDLVRVLNPIRLVPNPMPATWAGMADMPAIPIPEDLPEQKKAAFAYLGKHKATLKAEGLTVSTSTPIDDRPAEALVRRGKRHRGTIIVLATTRPGPVERAFIGSVGDKVVRTAAGPVLLVPHAGT